jgi:glycosyltransferase involved in cell wall biosynthesis
MSGPIAYLTGEYPRATDTFIQREVAELRRQGMEVMTCSIRQTGTEHHVGAEQRQEAAATFHVLAATAKPMVSIRAHIAALTRAPGRYFGGLALALRTAPPGAKGMLYQLFYFAEAVVLAEHLRQSGIRHLHNHIAKSSCSVAMLASHISGIGFSFTLHGPDIFFEPMLWRLDEKIARARFVACISQFCRSQAMVFSAPIHWDKLRIVHCGVVPSRYETPPKGDGAHLLFVGRLAAVKGLPVLFEAIRTVLAEHPALRLTLIGDGPERGDLTRMVARMGLADVVGFAGYRGQDEVAEALGQADMLVLPSFAEGVPVVLMEAMAAGLPVLTTQIAGVPELVRDGESGVLVPPGDAAALAEGLRRLLGDPALRARMGAAGRAYVAEHFNVKTEAAKLGVMIRTEIERNDEGVK